MTLTHRGRMVALALALATALIVAVIVWSFVSREAGQTVGVVGGLTLLFAMTARGWSL